MKNNQNLINALSALLNELTSASNTSETVTQAVLPKKRRKLSGRVNKPIQVSDQDVVLVNVPKNRIKLPRAMFRNCNTIAVDGYGVWNSTNDNGRSTYISADTFDASVGDTLEFNFEGIHRGTANYTLGNGKAKAQPKDKAKAQPKDKAKASPKGKAQAKKKLAIMPKREAMKIDFVEYCESVASEQAIENAADGFLNENIVSVYERKGIKADDIYDARVYLTSEQHQNFRQIWKSQEMRLKDAIEVLNEACGM